MINNRRNAGFTLIELMIVVAIIAIIASVAMPKLMSARISANENAAVATLRSISASQQQIQASCAIDTDADGGGEFAFFGEMAGELPLRVYDNALGGAALGSAPDDLLDPPFLSTAFGMIAADARGDGVVERSGYLYKIYLPGPTAASATPGFGEAPAGGAKAADATPATWGANNCEILWCAYAWPVDAEKTGKRTFFVNQEGDILQFHNRDQAYEGLAVAANVPAFDAAYSSETGGADMEAPLGIAAMGKVSNDAKVWTVVGN